MEQQQRDGFVRHQLPVILWGALIFVASSIPGTNFPNVPVFDADKLVHMGIYFVFCMLAHRAFSHQHRFPLFFRYSLAFSVLLTLVYGISDEFHQYFVPSRSSDVYDVAADVVGGLLFVMFISVSSRMRSNAKSRKTQEG
jgi:VanZ family protein